MDEAIGHGRTFRAAGFPRQPPASRKPLAGGKVWQEKLYIYYKQQLPPPLPHLSSGFKLPTPRQLAGGKLDKKFFSHARGPPA